MLWFALYWEIALRAMVVGPMLMAPPAVWTAGRCPYVREAP